MFKWQNLSFLQKHITKQFTHLYWSSYSIIFSFVWCYNLLGSILQVPEEPPHIQVAHHETIPVEVSLFIVRPFIAFIYFEPNKPLKVSNHVAKIVSKIKKNMCPESDTFVSAWAIFAGRLPNEWYLHIVVTIDKIRSSPIATVNCEEWPLQYLFDVLKNDS